MLEEQGSTTTLYIPKAQDSTQRLQATGSSLLLQGMSLQTTSRIKNLVSKTADSASTCWSCHSKMLMKEKGKQTIANYLAGLPQTQVMQEIQCRLPAVTAGKTWLWSGATAGTSSC